MKNYILTSVVLCLLAITERSFATTVGGSGVARQHLIAARDLSNWSAALNMALRTRDVTVGGGSFEMDQSLVKGCVGYDVLRWVTVYGIIGGHDTDAGFSSRGTELLYGAGAAFYLVDHDIASLWLLEDGFSISATIEYVLGRADLGLNSFDYSELYSTITFSFINQVESGRAFWPNAISIFGGPVMSVLGGDFDESTAWGANAGVKFFLTENVALYAGAEFLDTASFIGGIEFDF